jgi:hypothetical protein
MNPDRPILLQVAARFGYPFVLLALFALLVGCIGGTVELPGRLEQPPLVEKLDVTVGAFFPGKARGYVLPTPVVRMHVGESSAVRLRQAWDALFAKVVDLPDWPPWRSQPPAVDGVIELADADMEVALGNDTNRPDRIHVRYRVCLYEPDATPVKCWTAEAEATDQRQLGDCLPDIGACIAQQADHVMREAVAHFLLEFEADPEVRRWAARKQAAR